MPTSTTSNRQAAYDAAADKRILVLARRNIMLGMMVMISAGLTAGGLVIASVVAALSGGQPMPLAMFALASMALIMAGRSVVVRATARGSAARDRLDAHGVTTGTGR